MAKEPHSEGGYHLHAGVFNRNASKHPATKKIRECFTEYNTVGMNLRLNLERKETTMVKDLKEEPGL